MKNAVSLGITSPPRVAITDEHPQNQKAFSEFLFYQSLFQDWGWRCDIVDTKDFEFDAGKNELRHLQNSFDLVYNRHTDFSFELPATQALKNAFVAKTVCVTPNPREYGLLADKERLLHLSNPDFLRSAGVNDSGLSVFANVVPRIFPISNFDRMTAKREREGYFFKPRRSFGGKAVYRGRSMSQKIFEDILFKDYLAQELVEPPTVTVNASSGPTEFKWDLRVYAYKDKPQLLIARLFRGK